MWRIFRCAEDCERPEKHVGLQNGSGSMSFDIIKHFSGLLYSNIVWYYGYRNTPNVLNLYVIFGVINACSEHL